MKIIFLDVDGVLNKKDTKERIYAPDDGYGFTGIEDEKVSLIKDIVDKTGAKIVISSSWREDKNNSIFEYYIWNDQYLKLLSADFIYKEYDEEHPEESSAYHYLEEKLAKYGLSIYSDTPIGTFRFGEERTQEILLWVNEHQDVENYVVLDDQKWNGMEDLNLVHTDYMVGLTKEDTEKAISILNYQVA